MSSKRYNIRFLLNQRLVETDSDTSERILDFVREYQYLHGTKEVCREGDCGACLILLGTLDVDGHLHYAPVNACLLPLGAVSGRHVVTIEGINQTLLNPIQEALVTQGAIQCGFCTPGIVLALTAFFLNSTEADSLEAMDAVAGNLCRCTGYCGIKRAVILLCERFDLQGYTLKSRLNDAIEWGLIPKYFAEIPSLLSDLTIDVAKDNDSEAIRVAGGTDLWLKPTRKLLSFLPPVRNSECVKISEQHYIVDAASTFEQLRTSPILQRAFPTITKDFRLIASQPIRQRGTLGGNLANASPIADLAVFFLALDADILLAHADMRREVKLREFFLGYKQIACEVDERILVLRFLKPGLNVHFSFEKVSKRCYLDIAAVNSAMMLAIQNGYIETAHLSAGGIAPIPLYLNNTSEFLRGKPLNTETVVAAASIAQTEISPISDLRGSAEYKRLLLRQLIYAHFIKLFPGYGWDGCYATH